MDAATHFWIVMAVSFGLAVPTALIVALLMQIRDAQRSPCAHGDLPAWRQQGAIALDAPAHDLATALRAVPGLVALPPQAGNGNAVIVAAADEGFVAAVRAAVCSVRSGEAIHLVGGIAPPDLRFDPHGRGRYLWRECWRDGALLGPEPRRRAEVNGLSLPHYWIVRPADGGPDDTALGLPAVLPACIVPTGTAPLALAADAAPRAVDWAGEW